MKHTTKFKCLMFVLLLAVFTLPEQAIYSQETKTQTTVKTQTDSIKENNETKKKKTSKGNDDKRNDKIVISGEIIQNISIAFFVIMLTLIILFFYHIRYKNQYLGFQSIKYIGLVLMFPGICILALVGGDKLISGSTLAALLGTIAGYVLSRERDDDGIGNNEQTENLNKQIKSLKEKEAALLKEIETLKQKLPKTKANE